MLVPTKSFAGGMKSMALARAPSTDSELIGSGKFNRANPHRHEATSNCQLSLKAIDVIPGPRIVVRITSQLEACLVVSQHEDYD